MDELTALVAAKNPDLICIVETWLSADITVAEIDVPGYIPCRCDRDRHGGGVMLYIRNTFQFTYLPNPLEGLEPLPSILQHSVIPARFCVSIFYRPPSSAPDALDDLYSYFNSIDSAQFINFVIVGDFNVDMSTRSHPLFQKCQQHNEHAWFIANCYRIRSCPPQRHQKYYRLIICVRTTTC